MGNKRSRETTRPKDRGRECVCDCFELSATFENGVLSISLVTELPANVRVLVKAFRIAGATDGSEWEWTLIERKVPVEALESSLRGFVLSSSIDELDGQGLQSFRYLARRMDLQVASSPGEIVTIELAAPTTSHQFGICNRNLTGSAVLIEKSGHRLQASSSMHVPVAESVVATLRK